MGAVSAAYKPRSAENVFKVTSKVGIWLFILVRFKRIAKSRNKTLLNSMSDNFYNIFIYNRV